MATDETPDTAAPARLTPEQVAYLVGADWYLGDDDRWHNDKTGESMDRHWSDD